MRQQLLDLTRALGWQLHRKRLLMPALRAMEPSIEMPSPVGQTPGASLADKRSLRMPFPLTEHNALLALKGVGPAVIARLEQMGIDSLAVLSKANACDILAQASAAVGSTCWKNSPQARAAINAAIELAKDSQLSTPSA